MGDEPTKDAWKSVGQQLEDLGGKFKQHYDDSADEEGPAASDEVRDALRTLGQGLERLFDAVGAAVRDPEVKDTAKSAGTSVVDALGATITTVADEIRTTFQRSRGEGDPVDIEVELDDAVGDAERELDDADAIDEIRADLEDDADPVE